MNLNFRSHTRAAGDWIGPSDFRAKIKREPRSRICSLVFIKKTFLPAEMWKTEGPLWGCNTLPILRRTETGCVGIDSCIRFMVSPVSFRVLETCHLAGLQEPTDQAAPHIPGCFSLTCPMLSLLSPGTLFLISEVTVANLRNHIGIPG